MEDALILGVAHNREGGLQRSIRHKRARRTKGSRVGGSEEGSLPGLGGALIDQLESISDSLAEVDLPAKISGDVWKY